MLGRLRIRPRGTRRVHERMQCANIIASVRNIRLPCMRPYAVLLVVATCVSACAMPGHAVITLQPQAKLSGPKEIAIIGTRGEVETTLEEHLRASGFRIKRFASTSTVSEATSSDRIETYRAASTRYGIETHWSLVDRCFGGGFRFAEFRVDLLDLRENEVVFSTKAKGYSEKCQPMSGSIFGDVATALNTLWIPSQRDTTGMD
jgi:hypothetical protein